MDKNYVKKVLLRSKEMASFSHYCAGTLYYHVKLEFDVYQFPIPTIDKSWEWTNDGEGDPYQIATVEVWIDKAIDSGEFIMIEVPVSPI